MRSQAIEAVLKKIIEELEGSDDPLVLAAYITKAKILMDRDDNRAASVVREMVNRS